MYIGLDRSLNCFNSPINRGPWYPCSPLATPVGLHSASSPTPSRIFQVAFFGPQQNKTSNVRAKPLDFQACTGENIRARDLSLPNETGSVRLWCKWAINQIGVDQRVFCPVIFQHTFLGPVVGHCSDQYRC